jgi:hypothetical protein
MSDFFYRLLDKPDILGVMIPILAIVGVITYAIVRKVFLHRERMAMIERGIHPDYPPEDEEVKTILQK